jgi:hypothetical protein
MTPLPANNTGVLFVDYSVCGENHTMEVRYDGGGSVADAAVFADQLLTAASPGLFLLTILGTRHRAAGSNVSLPTIWPGSATYGSGSGAHYQSAWYADLVGRSDDGRRCRIAVFGFQEVADTTNNDYRVLRSESSIADDMVAAAEAGVHAPASIGGFLCSWHQYINIGVNAYWRNRIR